MSSRVIRISRGAFEPSAYSEIKSRLTESKAVLTPALRNLNGCLHYYVGIDSVSNTMVNVSLWKTLEDAKQMDKLAPMLALAAEFIGLGVRFERPITNCDVLWEL